MMRALLWLVFPWTAGAGNPLGPVHHIAPFTMDKPDVYTMRGDHSTYQTGHLVVFSAPPDLLTPQQLEHPLPYLGAWPLRLAATDEHAGCAVAIVLTQRPLHDEPLYLGPDTLPERVMAEDGEAARTVALSQGTQPLGHTLVQQALGPRLHFTDRRDLAVGAASLLGACDQTDPQTPQ
jgi:hypothetical protein